MVLIFLIFLKLQNLRLGYDENDGKFKQEQYLNVYKKIN